MAELKDIAASLDELLGSVDLSKVTASGVGFEDLEDGYYLGEVANDTKLTVTKNTGEAMVSMKFVIVEDGLKNTLDENNVVVLAPAKGTKGRSIYINYVLRDVQSVKRFVSDMLKFEDPNNPGEPILGEEYFKSTELLTDALSCLITSRIYINVQTVEKNGEKKQRFNLVKWDRCPDLGLPM